MTAAQFFYSHPTAQPNGCRIRAVHGDRDSSTGPLTHVAACGATFTTTQGVPFQQTTAYQEWLAHTYLTTTRSAS